MSFSAKWIKPKRDFGDVCPTFTRVFKCDLSSDIKATLLVTAMGVYEAELNGERIGKYVLAPGWTSPKRIQYQAYDISHLLREENTLTITVGKGWLRSPLATWVEALQNHPRLNYPPGLYATIEFGNGERIETDTDWLVRESRVRFSEIYNGEAYDANMEESKLEPVVIFEGLDCEIVPQQGEEIRELDIFAPLKIIKSPKGEKIVDFGQNITGYVELCFPTTVKSGDIIELSFAETLDKDNNFYTENYRTAKPKLRYICKDGKQENYKPKFTFFGFRYIRLDAYPCELDMSNFRAIVVHSDMKRTGYFSCSNPLLNRLFENIVWGQKGNFLDVPTDCPQRDERLGWTGDAQVFIKIAAYNYDIEKFFNKWLTDLALEQREDGHVPHVVPDTLNDPWAGAAWGDAVTICPWQIYLSYGNVSILEQQFQSMCKWLDYIATNTKDEYLWTGCRQFGDWLSLELPQDGAEDIRKGNSRYDFIASAFYFHSTSLVIKAGKVLNVNTSQYELLQKNIATAFKERFSDYRTQTEHILALHFGLVPYNKRVDVANSLAKMIQKNNNQMATGFVGTPYLLHVLSENGHLELAYTLLLREEYPSWLYPVTKGATTIWERWDSIKPDGSFQTASMNSFNHYAYGAVADWMYGVAAGIQPLEEQPGYKKVKIAPKTDSRLKWLSAQYESRFGWIRSKWQYIDDNTIRYDIEVPVLSEIIIGDDVYNVEKGLYTFYSTVSI